MIHRILLRASSSSSSAIVPSSVANGLHSLVLGVSSPAKKHLSKYSTCLFQRFLCSKPPFPPDTDTPKPGDKPKPHTEEETDNQTKTHAATDSEPHKEGKRRRRSTAPKRTSFSDSDEDDGLSRDDLVKLVARKEEMLKNKNKEIEMMQDKVKRSDSEVENIIDRSKREAESSKKYAIQNFAKSLLDVADSLSRASAAVKENISEIDSSKDLSGAASLLKTLLDGVNLTEKQLSKQVLKEYGVEKFNPLNEQFDPQRHHALFRIPDVSKPSGTVAAVVKAGYMLHDRLLRPAEVGVTEGQNGDMK
ncbi:hypothetical protein LUZ63_006378 [Rhynchospora breviuscula]|uniref:GrpE protein homolog n=1 Tax=Rhynchospora breviuscula TaxID=2022672 RepID=A0A9Q0CPN5_9POAL|nr:hypothetical protein LUZ63_006378 [Rhynchospora breviuscula]